MNIPFNIPSIAPNEEAYMLEALRSQRHCGSNAFSKRCVELMKKKYGFLEVFLNPSCSLALEMGTMLAGVGPGDEVILPSYTFSSTANAVIRHGARPVFCEIEPNTMNIDVTKIEALITPKTKMIIPIDYAGIPCDIDAIMDIALRHHIVVMVDSAQSFHSFSNGKPIGTLPDLTAFSFHETKNVTCGEGGALIVNRPEWLERAYILQEKGTDRKLVLDGVKSKYHWVDIGSSFLLADILSAMLLAQIEDVEHIVEERAKVTQSYTALFAPYETAGHLRIPHPPKHVTLNHHAFFLIFDTSDHRRQFLSTLKEQGVSAYIGYIPLHSSPMGQRYGYAPEDLPLTEDLAARIVRLPFSVALAQNGLPACIQEMQTVLTGLYGHS